MKERKMKIEDKTTGSIWIDLATKRRLEKEKEGKNKPWHCLKCGKCCKFIVIPVQRKINLETEAYLMAHGIALLPPPAPSPTGGGPGRGSTKLVIPAVCKYLKKGDLRGNKGEYYCSIHNNKFANCRLGGQKECEEAQKAWKLLEEMEK